MEDFVKYYWVKFKLPYPFHLVGNQGAPSRYVIARDNFGVITLYKDGNEIGGWEKIREIMENPDYDGSWNKPLKLLGVI